MTVPALAAQGTWTVVPNNPGTGGNAFGLWLLTDGSVLSHGNALNQWSRLIPGSDGNYADGTWVQETASPWAMGGATERILNDGRFMESGAEYIYAEPSGYSSTDYNNVQIFDPLANAWTIGAPGLYGDIGDSGTAVLANGTVYGSSRSTTAAEIYNPATNVWTAAAGHSWGSGDEDAWTSLPNGGVFALCNTGSGVYNPANNTWTQIQFPSPFSPGDIGPTELMYNGKVLCLGYQSTAIFTPGSTPSTGTWVNGPALPGGSTEEAEDEYGCCEPNGLVMFAAYPTGSGPNELLEYNPTSNTFTAITPPPDASGPYPVSYCDLPNGQVMVTCGANDWLYTPASAPSDSWRPTVTSVASNGNNVYTVTGTQLTGLVNGWDEGDDMSGAENYPIVSLTNSTGNVWYCKSFNFSNRMPSAGSAAETCQFTPPTGLASGTYSLYVSAVGVKSKTAYSVTITSVKNFLLTAAPSALSINQGTAGTTAVKVTDLNGFSSSVTFTATGLPSGVTAGFSPTSSKTGSTLTLTASSSATVGNAVVTIKGTSGSTTATTTVAINIIKVTPAVLKAQWAFNQSTGTSVTDASGNGHTGTVTGGTWSTTHKTGSYSVSFAGSGAMTAATGIVDTSQSFTVSCWAYLSNLSAYEDFLTEDGANVSSFFLQYNPGLNAIVFNRLGSDSTSAGSTYVAAASSPTVNTWYFITAVYDSGANTMTLYLNGASQGSTAAPAGWNGSGVFCVGRGMFNAGSTDWLSGNIDDARIYSGTMTAAQVSSLYSSGG